MSFYEQASQTAMEIIETDAFENGQSFFNAIKKIQKKVVKGWLIPLKRSLKSTFPLKIELCESETYTIGRNSCCDFQLDQNMFEEEDENLQHNKISRLHISLENEDGKMMILNKSANGTFVNGVQVSKKVLLDGDRIGALGEEFELFIYRK